MKGATYLIQPRDPLLVRDGRPFGADPGALASSLEWPLPSTVAGAVRTFIGNRNGFDWSTDGPARARSISVRGPLMAALVGEHWHCYLSAPADAVIADTDAEKPRLIGLRPARLPEGAGCDLPDSLIPLDIEGGFKPLAGYTYWPLEDTAEWLAGRRKDPPENSLGGLPRESRVHVRIDSSTGASLQGGLFVTDSICLPDVAGKQVPATAILCKAEHDLAGGSKDGFLPLGGERRVSAVRENLAEWPACPEILKAAAMGKRLKLQLVTPGIFTAGWKPGWIGNEIPGTGVRVTRLVSAAIHRRIAISGWDYERRQPKAARYACPAGSVYFLEIDTELTPKLFERLWMHVVSDDEQDNRDGFGMVIPGIWHDTPKEDLQ